MSRRSTPARTARRGITDRSAGRGTTARTVGRSAPDRTARRGTPDRSARRRDSRIARLSSIAMVVLSGAACESFQPEWVETLSLRPDSLHISIGETASFEAIPLSERGDELLDRAARTEWTLTGGSVASLDAQGATGQVTATALGSARVTARLGRGEVRGNVYVQPSGLDRIAIVPDRIEIAPGQRPRVEAQLFDASGALLSPEGFRISWKFVDTSIGFVGTPIGPSADLLGRRTGTTELRLIVGDRSTGIPFIVR